MRNTLLLTAMLLGLAIFPARAQELPLGPGREETVRGCSGCHGVGLLFGEHHSQYLWSTTVGMMVRIGAPVPDQEFDTVVAYLTAQFGPRPAPVTGSAPVPRR